MVLSSASKCSSIQESHPRKLPNVIDYYNQTKGGVDVMDRMVGNYSVKYKSKRWHVTIFCNLLDIACLNAFVLYNEVFPEENKSHRRRLFLISLGTNLSADYRNSRCQMPRQISRSACPILIQLSLQPGEPGALNVGNRKLTERPNTSAASARLPCVYNILNSNVICAEC